jgi:lysophospholipase L1-like esterase
MRALLLLLLATVSSLRANEFLPGIHRILFLGDSITHAGQYVDDFDIFLTATYPDRAFEVIACGLPSETVSGLSEEGHANGEFPRPDLHERLDRVLTLVKPDLVFACYGMNCGIYLPLDEERFDKYQQGIHKLIEKTQAMGAKIILITPPVYDAQGEPGFDYDSVLATYSEWLLKLRQQGLQVVDLHSVMRSALEKQRGTNPTFTYSKDKVHPNAEGHLVMAGAIISELAGEDSLHKFQAFLQSNWARSDTGKIFLNAIRTRRFILGEAYLTAAGHNRPGMTQGLPLPEALQKVQELNAQIQAAQP